MTMIDTMDLRTEQMHRMLPPIETPRVKVSAHAWDRLRQRTRGWAAVDPQKLADEAWKHGRTTAYVEDRVEVEHDRYTFIFTRDIERPILVTVYPT